LTASIQVPHFVGTDLVAGWARVCLSNAVYSIAFDVGLSETLFFFFIKINLFASGELGSNFFGNTLQSMSQATKMNSD
jgi:hypothetical protein